MYFTITNFFFIVLVCYTPILSTIIPATNFGAGIPDIGPVRGFTYLVVLLFIFESAASRKRFEFNKFIGIILVFSMICCLSVIWSPYYTYSGYVLQELMSSVFFPFIIAFVAVNILQDQKSIHRLMAHLAFAAFLLSIIALFQFAAENANVFGEIRAKGTFNNSNLLAIFLVLTIPCQVYLLGKNVIRRRWEWLFLITTICGVLSTVSRKGAMTMLLSFLLISFLKKKKTLFVTLMIIAGVLALALSGFAVFSERYQSGKVERDFSGKLYMALAGVKMFTDSPIIGKGYKGYYESFGDYFPDSFQKKYDAHNIFATALANYGLIGFLPFMAIFIYPLIHKPRTLESAAPVTDSFLMDMRWITISTIIPFMVNGFFAGGLFYAQLIIFLFYTVVSFGFAKNWEEGKLA